MATQSQIAANRENALKSTGPVTQEGKNKSSRNAVKTGLTGQTVLLPSDDADLYAAHIERLAKKFQPFDDTERARVQSIADTEWRLARIPRLEAGILAVGRYELSILFADIEDPKQRDLLIEGKVQLTYKKDLSNLALQETRLRRHLLADIEELEKLQAPRKKAEAKAKNMDKALDLYLEATSHGHRFVPQIFGFEFSEFEVEEKADLLCFKNNMLGKYKDMTVEEYEEAYWRFCGKYYPPRGEEDDEEEDDNETEVQTTREPGAKAAKTR